VWEIPAQGEIRKSTSNRVSNDIRSTNTAEM